MPRVFVHYDSDGSILSVASIETMDAELEHPFLLMDTTHGVLEIDPEHPALSQGAEHLHHNVRVDHTGKRLVGLEKTSKPPAKKAKKAKKKSSRKKKE